MKSLVWINYDLGLQGDVESLYAWLDNHGANECGDSAAVFHYEHNGDLAEDLREDLSKTVEIGKRDRIYIVWSDGKKTKGRFLFGSRKANPWVGYGSHQPVVDEEA